MEKLLSRNLVLSRPINADRQINRMHHSFYHETLPVFGKNHGAFVSIPYLSHGTLSIGQEFLVKYHICGFLFIL